MIQTRLSSLIVDSKALAEYLGCSIQAINQFKCGKALPKIENLVKIARFYNVSADYVLGLTDFAKPYISVSDYTGLTESAIETLRHMGKEELSALSRFLELTEK